jgi:N-acetylglucosamine-6-sulfatase
MGFHRLALPLLLAALACVESGKPNFVWILADDLNNDYKQDRLSFMPNLSKIKAAGAHFINHAAVQPVCGPSRSSLLSGRFPHNTGYVCNSDRPSENHYRAIQNNSIGTWLTTAGYHTSFIGKYVNGLEQTVPEGWNFWGGFSSSQGTYNYMNSTPWNITFDRTGTTPTSPVEWVAMTGTHQAEFVGQWGVKQMGAAVAAGLPFFVHLTPLMIHYGVCYGPLPKGETNNVTDPYWEKDLTNWGCNMKQNKPCSLTISPCVSLKNEHAFDGHTNPHTPSWNVSASGPLPSSMVLRDISEFTSNRQDIGFRNRSAALLDLDSLLGVVLDGIEALGVADNTYVIFTSDNGYHLAEHKMPMGKEHPYETDVSLPMYIKGPGVPANTELLYPTFVLLLLLPVFSALIGGENQGAAAPTNHPTPYCPPA